MNRKHKTIRAIIGAILLLIIILFMTLLFKSPGKPQPFRGTDNKKIPGSIALTEKININGIGQGLIIRGIDSLKPVLLYVHGGPGSPEFPFVKQFNSGIENLFVVCYWEQRGSGISFSNKIPDATMTLSQFIDDGAEVTRYLLKRFNRNKIYLMGHSWGSYLGAFMAQKNPQYYNALITIGQVAKQQESEIISYNYVLAKAKELGDRKAVSDLEKMGVPPYSDPDLELKNLLTERKYVTKYGGAVKIGNFYREAMSALLNCREYSLKNKINYMKGMNYTLKFFWNPLMKSDLFKEIPSQAIPVYIMQGTNDYQTAYKVAREYFDSLNAPVKEFFPFENSAHSPIFEEPAKFEEVLKGIIAQNDSIMADTTLIK